MPREHSSKYCKKKKKKITKNKKKKKKKKPLFSAQMLWSWYEKNMLEVPHSQNLFSSFPLICWDSHAHKLCSVFIWSVYILFIKGKNLLLWLSIWLVLFYFVINLSPCSEEGTGRPKTSEFWYFSVLYTITVIYWPKFLTPHFYIWEISKLSEFTINWYWYHLRFTQLNCQGPKNCNQICNYVIIEKHVERFPPDFFVHHLTIKYPHVL
jgi:hypothetical protein